MAEIVTSALVAVMAWELSGYKVGWQVWWHRAISALFALVALSDLIIALPRFLVNHNFVRP